MKKRIISLILVAVMALLALSGCAYSYEKDDMSKYATFDAEKEQGKEPFASHLVDSCGGKSYLVTRISFQLETP